MYGLDTLLVVRRPTVGQIIAIDDCDHDVIERHSLDSSGELLRLICVWRLWGAERFNAAEPAATSAFFAGDHERRRAARPTIIEIRAASFLADRVQSMIGHCVVRRIEHRELLAGR